MDKPELDFIPTMGNAAARARSLFGSRAYVVMPERRLTFAEVDLASRRVAKELLARGIGKGTRVAIHFSYGPEWAIAFFAVTRIGAVCLPMSTVYTPVESMASQLETRANRDVGVIGTRLGWAIHRLVDFMSIHPLEDGNGRVARCLFLLDLAEQLGLATPCIPG